MWETRRLRNLWASTACYRDIFFLRWPQSCDHCLKFLTPTLFKHSSAECSHLSASLSSRRVPSILCRVNITATDCNMTINKVMDPNGTQLNLKIVQLFCLLLSPSMGPRCALDRSGSISNFKTRNKNVVTQRPATRSTDVPPSLGMAHPPCCVS
jgi:hypothetical protein